jgi:uncharacterized protein (TIGR00375 family)
MQIVSDLHLHSKYSRAVSQDMNLPTMAKYAAQKGLDLLSAPDFLHPVWFKEMKAQLEEKSEGIYGLRSAGYSNGQDKIRFMLVVEVASIYTQKGKLRRIHNLIFSPNIETAEKIQQAFLQRGCNISSDGRPIVGISSKDLVEMLINIDERIFLIPCHAWTPHFGIYGSASGFDSLEESFDELTPHIYGIETGISSDPEMNWRIPDLMGRSILSFSDAHSPAKMGREATVLELGELTYGNVRNAIMRKPGGRIIYTIEFYPEEGKYHFSGHRNCKIVRAPEEIKRDGNICSVCNKKLTEGVLFRVEQLTNTDLEERVEEKIGTTGVKWFTDKLKKQPPYVKLVPLLEIVAESMESTVFSQKVKTVFADLCSSYGSEIEVLLKTPIESIHKSNGEKLAEGIRKVREGGITIDPGYDGEYGKVAIWEKHTKAEKEQKVAQPGLF